jgi:hypothetical protein
MVNAAGMRTFVFGAVGLLCLGALFFGTSGGRELVVAVVVGPALTVLVAVVVVGALTVLVAVVTDEVVALVVGRVELEECPEPPQAAISSVASMAAQSARRVIGAL